MNRDRKIPVITWKGDIKNASGGSHAMTSLRLAQPGTGENFSIDQATQLLKA